VFLGDLEMEVPSVVQGQSPGMGSGGQSHPEAETFFAMSNFSIPEMKICKR